MQYQWNLKHRICQVTYKTGFNIKSCQDGNTSGFEKPQQAEYLKLNSIPFTIVLIWMTLPTNVKCSIFSISWMLKPNFMQSFSLHTVPTHPPASYWLWSNNMWLLIVLITYEYDTTKLLPKSKWCHNVCTKGFFEINGFCLLAQS